MNLKLLLPLFLICSASYGQHLVSKHFYKSYTNSQIDSAYNSVGLPGIVLPNDYEVDIYHLMYNTVMPDSITPTIASGLFIVPKNKSCASTILSYQHGTIVSKAEAPSKRGNMEWIIGLAMATEGYISVLPDYIGLGYDVTNRHPYQHARSEATSTIDMIRASREACADLNIDLNGQVLLAGYSQGGHATMAAHRMIQNSFSSEFNISASVPMSGPYSMSGVMMDVILQNTPYPAPYYLPYVLLSFQDIYQPYSSVSDFLNTPYNTTLPPLYDGYSNAGIINSNMPSIAKNIIKQQVIDSVEQDNNHHFNQILRNNDVYNWVPNNPVHILYCSSDEHVPKENAFEAYNYMSANNAPVTILNVSDQLGHSDCAQMALLQMRSIIDTIRYDKISVRFSEVKPTVGNSDGSITVNVLGVNGPYNISWNTGDTTQSINNLSSGAYSVTITSPNACNSYTGAWFLNNAILSTEDLNSKSPWNIFPNPGNGLLKISGTDIIEKIRIYSVTGQLLYETKEISQNHELEIQNFKSGMYIIQVNNDIPIRYIKH